MARTVDTLYVACTRPAMKWGVTYDGCKANFIITLLLTTLIIQSPLGFFLGGGVHLAFRELCRIDPHFFRKYSLWFQTKARSTTRMIWGGSRLQPTASRVRKASDIRFSI